MMTSHAFLFHSRRSAASARLSRRGGALLPLFQHFKDLHPVVVPVRDKRNPFAVQAYLGRIGDKTGLPPHSEHSATESALLVEHDYPPAVLVNHIKNAPTIGGEVDGEIHILLEALGQWGESGGILRCRVNDGVDAVEQQHISVDVYRQIRKKALPLAGGEFDLSLKFPRRIKYEHPFGEDVQEIDISLRVEFETSRHNSGRRREPLNLQIPDEAPLRIQPANAAQLAVKNKYLPFGVHLQTPRVGQLRDLDFGATPNDPLFKRIVQEAAVTRIGYNERRSLIAGNALRLLHHPLFVVRHDRLDQFQRRDFRPRGGERKQEQGRYQKTFQ